MISDRITIHKKAGNDARFFNTVIVSIVLAQQAIPLLIYLLLLHIPSLIRAGFSVPFRFLRNTSERKI